MTSFRHRIWRRRLHDRHVGAVGVRNKHGCAGGVRREAGHNVGRVAVTVSVMFVPEAVPAFTCSTSVKFAVPFTAEVLLSVQVIVPVPPTAGTVPQVHPAGGSDRLEICVRRRGLCDGRARGRRRRTVVGHALRIGDVASRRHRTRGCRIRRDQDRPALQWQPHLPQSRCYSQSSDL